MSDEDRAKLSEVLTRLIELSQREELSQTTRVLSEAMGVLAYEAAGYRIPKCTSCGLPLSDDDRVLRINRDRGLRVDSEAQGVEDQWPTGDQADPAYQDYLSQREP